MLARRVDPARAQITASGDFQITQEGVSGGNVPLLRLFDSSGTRIVSLYHQNLAGNKIRVTHSGVGVPTTGTLPLGTWGHFDLYVLTDGTASTLEVRLNGAVIYRTPRRALGRPGSRRSRSGTTRRSSHSPSSSTMSPSAGSSASS
jgi:hypothetical protein